MEATVIKIGASLGFMVPDSVIETFDVKEGTKVEMNNFVFGKKSKVRTGWDTAFAQYAKNGEDELMLPDFLDLETEKFL